jgi:hypothetical protein
MVRRPLDSQGDNGWGSPPRLYLDGVIDQWFIQQDNSGVVLLLNVTDADKAHGLLENCRSGKKV